jgi:hypothetical protein
MLVRIFDPPKWAIHRWVWWWLNVFFDFLWRCVRWVLRLVIAVSDARPGARYRGREDVHLKGSPMRGVEISSARVVEVLRRAEHARPVRGGRSAVEGARRLASQKRPAGPQSGWRVR